MEKITVEVPNRDSHLGTYTVCPKEVLQKAYTDKIGKTIEWCGVSMMVTDVTITDNIIALHLEVPRNV